MTNLAVPQLLPQPQAGTLATVPKPPFHLVVMSNRGPYNLRQVDGNLKYEKTVGGLATAVLPILEKTGGVWIAWGEPEGRHPSPPGRPPFELRYVSLSAEEVDDFYRGVSNSAFWPLCHYFLGRVEYHHSEWETYEKVNEKFAQVALEESAEDDVIWVHDYHFARVPFYIRQQRPNARIAFFWHIPFPAPEMFRTLPWRQQVLESMLACDVIGFHIPEYVKNFKETCVELLAASAEGDRVRFRDHTSELVALPIAIDYEAQEKQARARVVERRVQRLRDSVGKQALMLGVERMDYTKGILERLRGFEYLLKTEHQWRDKVSFFQIVTPSREGVAAYREKKREIDEIVGRINGTFSNDLWVPVHYIYRSFAPARLAVYYRAADIALVTPLRDGLNLVAKEYVASRVHQDGVLILSEFAGVTCQLPEALICNPYDVQDMAHVISEALKMSPEEQRHRMIAMQARLKKASITWWMKEFLDRMSNIKP